MSLTRGLVELKLLDKRINSTIDRSNFVDAVKGKKDITCKLIKKTDFQKDAKANIQSIKSLIERRNCIKCAIVAKNAKTKVRISGKNYSIAEAIERKNSIIYEQRLLSKLKSQLNKAEEMVNEGNDTMERTLDTLLGQQLSADKKNTNDAKDFIKSYKQLNEYKLFDPLKVRKLIDEYEEDIDNFLAEVDLILSESNANTFIEIQK